MQKKKKKEPITHYFPLHEKCNILKVHYYYNITITPALSDNNSETVRERAKLEAAKRALQRIREQID